MVCAALPRGNIEMGGEEGRYTAESRPKLSPQTRTTTRDMQRCWCCVNSILYVWNPESWGDTHTKKCNMKQAVTVYCAYLMAHSPLCINMLAWHERESYCMIFLDRDTKSKGNAGGEKGRELLKLILHVCVDGVFIKVWISRIGPNWKIFRRHIFFCSNFVLFFMSVQQQQQLEDWTSHFGKRQHNACQTWHFLTTPIHLSTLQSASQPWHFSWNNINAVDLFYLIEKTTLLMM